MQVTTIEARPQALTEKYRPATLDAIYGQFSAIRRLRDYVDMPFPAAFVFEGDTGTGKTSAAMALAHELGVDLNWSFQKIDSGAADAKAVEDAVRSMRYSVTNGGYRMILVDEADTMSPKAKELFLSILEEIPGRNVIIFTTNHPDRLPRRFLDRCQRVKFESDPVLLRQDAEALLTKIWVAEGLPGQPFAIEGNPEIIIDNSLSFRRVVQAVQGARYARPAAGATPSPAAASPPVKATAKAAKGDARPVAKGYKPKGYSLVVARTVTVNGAAVTHELYVNPTGWRFEYVVRVGDFVSVTVTHSVKQGNAWEITIRDLEVSVG